MSAGTAKTNEGFMAIEIVKGLGAGYRTIKSGKNRGATKSDTVYQVKVDGIVVATAFTLKRAKEYVSNGCSWFRPLVAKNKE